jgi:hopanoid biosynthesis associated protein HpnK
MAACRLIVHADDFGLSERVNEGIAHAHRNGILTSASLIAAGAAFETAISMAGATPGLDVGVHLTLIEERSVSPPASIRSLLGENGRLHRGAGAFLERYLRGAIALGEVRRELDAQIGAVVARGIKVSHLDGHQHLHMVPRIRRIVGELARKYGIPAIRYPRESLRPYMLKEGGHAARLAQLLALNLCCSMTGANDAKRPDHFFGFFYGGRLSKQRLMTVLDHLPASGTCELMCHPGLEDVASRYGHWGYRWKEECDALTDIEVRDHLRAKGIQLISYRDLQAPGAAA